MTSNRRSPQRSGLLALGAAAAAAAAGVLVRDRYDFEDTAAIVTLLVACTAAAVAAGIAAFAWLRSLRAAFVHGLTAAGLVLPLLVLYYLVRIWTGEGYS